MYIHMSQCVVNPLKNMCPHRASSKIVHGMGETHSTIGTEASREV